MRATTTLAILLASGSLLGCGGGYTTTPTTSSHTSPPPAGTPNSVVVTDNSFTPASLSTTPASTVTWTWDSCRGGDGYGAGQTCTAHDITFDDGTKSGALSSGTFTRTFATAGTYPYHCSIHGAAMSGTVVVK